MKIQTTNSDYGKRKEELLNILRQPSYSEKRPCAACTKICPCVKRSSHCTCCCSPDCAEAPRMLSSDPIQYPIETKVVGIVFSLSELRVVQPCWSCEGHVRENDSLARKPQIWFYSDSALYPELIANYIDDLHFDGLIDSEWTIKINSHLLCNSTMFILHPENNSKRFSNARYLTNLQNDIQIIANSLRMGIFNMANSKLEQYYK